MLAVAPVLPVCRFRLPVKPSVSGAYLPLEGVVGSAAGESLALVLAPVLGVVLAPVLAVPVRCGCGCGCVSGFILQVGDGVLIPNNYRTRHP